jgi:hypothetical protein
MAILQKMLIAQWSTQSEKCNLNNLPSDFYASSRLLKNFSNPLGGLRSFLSNQGINLYIIVGLTSSVIPWVVAESKTAE